MPSFMAFVGILLMLVATNVVPSADEKFHAPRWVLFVCGLLFALPRFASLFSRIRARHLLAAMLFCFAVIFIGCGALGDAKGFSGGLAFLSHDTNVLWGRSLFIGVGLMLFVGSFACAFASGTILDEKNSQDRQNEDVEI